MSLLSDGGLRYGNGVTYGALLTVGKTGSGAGCCSAGNGNLGVSLLSDGGLCLDNSVTYGALLTVGKTGLGTGCCLAGDSNYGVTLSRNCLGVGVAAVYASVGLNACTLASRSGGNLACIVGVALSINSGLCYGNGATYGALLTLGKTGLGAGRSYCRDGNLGVTECGVLINNGVGNATAIVTGSGLSAVLGAGCVAIGYVVGEAVSNGNSLVAADVTDCILAIGVAVVAVYSKSSKDLVSNVLVAAYVSVGNVNVEYVLILNCEREGITRGILCNLIKIYSKIGKISCVISEFCKHVCDINCYVADYNVCIDVKTVVVTKSCNSCIGVNLIDGNHGLVVVDIVLGVSVKSGVNSVVDNVHNGDLNGVVRVLTKLSVEPILLEHRKRLSHAECICVSVKKLNNVCGVDDLLGNACLYECVIDLALNLLNVGKVLLTNESGPVKLVNGALNVGCKNAVDSAVKSYGDLLDTCGSKYAGKCVCDISVKLCTKNSVNVLACVCDTLNLCILNSGSAAVSNGDEVSASDVSNGNGCHSNLLVLVSAKVKSLCDDVSVAVVAVNDCKVEGVLGKLDLTGNDSCDVILDSLNNSDKHCVGIGLSVAAVYDCVNSLNNIVNLCVSCCNDSLNLCDSSLNLSVEYYDCHLKLCYCSVELSLCICDCSCKLSLNLCDSCLKLCLYSCDLCKDSCLCLANCSHKLLVKNVELILSLCNKSIDLKLCLCLESENIGSSVYDCDLKKGINVVYVSGKSCKKLVNLYEGLCIECVCIVNKSSYSIDGSLCVCEGVSKSGSELYALDVLGILCNPSLCEVNVGLRIVKVCIDHIDHAGLNSLCVCYLVSLIIVLKNEVSKDSEILNSLVLCGVLGLVCGDNSLFKNVVSCCGGVTTKTVTNYASAHKAKKTCNGFVGLKSGAKCLGKREESSSNLDHLCVFTNLGYDHIRDRCSDISRIGSAEYRNHNSLCCCCDFLRTVTMVENGKNILCGYYKIKVNSNLILNAGLKVSFNKSCYNSASSHCLGHHACLNILLEGIKNACEQGSVNIAKTKNSIKSYRSIYGVKDSILNSKIYSNGNCLFCIRCSISELLLIIHKLVSHDLFESNGNKRKRALKERPNCAVTIFTNDSLNESITDNGIGVRSAVYVEIITVNLNKALDSTSLCIVEGCICVSCVLANLLKGRICSKECVGRSYNSIHNLADSNALYLTLVNEGVHNSNLNKLNVGIHCNDGIVERHVADNHRKADVSCLLSDLADNLVFSVLCRQSLKNLCHKYSLVSKNLFLSLRIKIANCSLNVVNVIIYVSSTLEANSVENSAEAEHTKVSVTNCKRDNVSIGYVLLEVLCDNGNLHCTVLTALKVSIGIVSSRILVVSGKLTLVYYTLILSALCLRGTGNRVISSIGSIVIADLGKSPEVTGGEYGVPKIFTFLATVCPLFLTSDKLCENVDRLSVVVIKSKKPKKVLNSDSGHSELCMLVCAKPCSELVRIRVLTVRFYTGAVHVSGKTVTIGHRVTKRNVMDSLVLVLVRVGNTSSESGSSKAEEHCACHDQSKNLRTYFFHIHIFSLSDTFSCQ